MKILLFASFAEKAGQNEIELISEKSLTVNQIKEFVQEKTGIENGWDTCFIAVNEEYADSDTIVSPQDTVAFIPPVSGG